MLYIDDSPDDLFLFQKACEQAGVAFRLELLGSGKEALDYFQGVGRYSDRSMFPLPNLVLLDLNMPLHDGFWFLRWLRDRPELNRVVVCLFTSSFQFEDIKTTYTLGADCFLTKPAAFAHLVNIAAALDQFLASAQLQLLKELPEFRQ